MAGHQLDQPNWNHPHPKTYLWALWGVGVSIMWPIRDRCTVIRGMSCTNKNCLLLTSLGLVQMETLFMFVGVGLSNDMNEVYPHNCVVQSYFNWNDKGAMSQTTPADIISQRTNWVLWGHIWVWLMVDSGRTLWILQKGPECHESLSS